MHKLLQKLNLKKCSIGFLLGATLLPTINANAQIITTVAGTGTGGYNSDGIQATAAELHTASGVAVDKAGNIFIADNSNNRVRRVDAITGIITTVAGTGTGGYNGDGIQATAAEVNRPWNVSLDTAGNVYIGDWGNDRMRKITVSTGIITTVAGNGAYGYNGDGIQATAAEVNYAQGMYIDKPGNIYFADVNNQRIRKINTAGIISTVAGTGTAGYNGDGIMATDAELQNPATVYLDTLGNIYFPDYYNNEVRKITVSTGIISSVAGNGIGAYSGDGGLATDAELLNPTGVSLDTDGNIYIADLNNHRIREVIVSSGIINTVAGNGIPSYYGDGGLATLAEINAPWDVCVTPGAFYIGEFVGDRIRKVTIPDISTGIELLSGGINAQVYPNPVTENLYVSLKGTNGKTSFTLFNSLGQQVLQEYSNERTTCIQVAGVSPGIYFLKMLTSDGTVLTQKVCIRKL